MGAFEQKKAGVGSDPSKNHTTFRYQGKESLKANTTYAIRVSAAHGDSSLATLAQTASDAEDSGGQAGWDLDEVLYRKPFMQAEHLAWKEQANALQVRLNARRGAAPAGLSVHDAEVYEAHGATLDFKVTLDPAPASGKSVKVKYETDSIDSELGYCLSEFCDEAAGQCRTTARVWRDYEPVEGTLTFAAGETLKTIRVPVIDDVVEDSGEGVALRLSEPSGSTPLARDAALGVIYNDEEAGEPSEVRIADAVAVAAGAAARELRFVVSLSAAGTVTVAVAYATGDATATEGEDYVGTEGTLTFAAGETEKTVTVAVLDDGAREGEETLRLGQRLVLGRASEWRIESAFGDEGRTYTAGYSYRLGQSFDLTLDATRREAADDEAPEHALTLRAGLRW